MGSSDNETPFLTRLAKELNQAEQATLVLLPNKRSLSVLQTSVGESEFISYLTIDQVMESLSGWKLLNSEELLVVFYRVYLTCEKKPQSFEQFSSWAPTFLKDINDVDLCLADVKRLFRHIEEYHSVGQGVYEEVGPIQKSFVSFWERLPKYYEAFTQELSNIQMAYRGAIYRKAADMAAANSQEVSDALEAPVVYWVGIVPGNPSEHVLISWLEQNRELHLMADVDQYYLSDPIHEAGALFRSFPNYKEMSWSVDALSTLEKDVSVWPVPGKMEQVVRLKSLLDKVPDRWNKSVVVLADPSLLIPFLEVFRSQQDKINVTLGYPLRNTAVHRFVMVWFQLHVSRIERSGDVLFYHKHLSEFLENDMVKQELSGVCDWGMLQKDVASGNHRFVSASWLKERLQDDLFTASLYELYFQWPNNLSEVFQRVDTVLKNRQADKTIRSNRLERKAVSVYREKLELLVSQFNEVLPEFDIKTIRRFIHQQIGFSTVHISEPETKALQVMEMLETRMLDFEDVYVLGASDDMLPGKVKAQTFIPFIHRLDFELPTYRDTEALVSYHFYRLIQRARNVHMLYNSSAEYLSGGEPSRFVLQMQYELATKNQNLRFDEHAYRVDLKARDQRHLDIPKHDDVMDSLRNYVGHKLSASAINKYINSPLEFYFFYVLGLREQNEVDEIMKPSTFGSAVHAGIERVYKPFEGKLVDVDVLKKQISTAEEYVYEEFLKEYRPKDLEQGQNLIYVQVAKRYVRSFIEFDLADMAQHGPVKIVAMEQHLRYSTTIGGERVVFTGFADRVDERHGRLRIIDFKTGKVSANQLHFMPEKAFIDTKQKYAIQLALYKWIYCRAYQKNSENVDCMIYSFRNAKNGWLSMQETSDDLLQMVDEFLAKLVADMFDTSKPFTHMAHSEYTTF